jgi:AcrR family transcriptional regulator
MDSRIDNPLVRQLWSKDAIEARFAEFGDDGLDQTREARKRRAILQAGYQLFLHHGYKKTTIDDVAKKSRVAKGTVYLYFANKAELLMHCVAFEKRCIKDEAAKLFAPETPDEERLRRWLRLSFYAVRDMPLSSRLMTGDMEMWDALEATKSQRMIEIQKEGLELCKHLIELAAPGIFDDDERRKRANVLIGLGFMSAHFLDARLRNDESLETFLDTLIDVLLHGFTTRPRP